MIIGVNSRNLVTFEMNPHLLRELRQLIPTDRVVVAESGIYSEADTRRLARYDVQGILVGESLVVSADIPGQIRQLLHGANASTQVKICGLRNARSIDTASEAGTDMLGFIFYKPSHRYIAPRDVPSLLAACERFVHPPAKTSAPDLVGVFVNEDVEFINETAEEAGVQFVQLHGDETPEFCQRIHRPVIKALSISSTADLERLKAYQQVAWRLLLDTPTPQWGGTGNTHDWELARLAAKETQIVLAGGLTPDNVSAAIQQIHPWGVDVSSGVETDKQKDPDKIRTFIQAVRDR
jgi:indole-3-glycerol phosphate synthase/phosphoribosylanthranilate isomerase/anthranilate synthase/indole-3-glycerol phosphate synthase/phosphoribosylanthranilate isomerase